MPRIYKRSRKYKTRKSRKSRSRRRYKSKKGGSIKKVFTGIANGVKGFLGIKPNEEEASSVQRQNTNEYQLVDQTLEEQTVKADQILNTVKSMVDDVREHQIEKVTELSDTLREGAERLERKAADLQSMRGFKPQRSTKPGVRPPSVYPENLVEQKGKLRPLGNRLKNNAVNSLARQERKNRGYRPAPGAAPFEREPSEEEGFYSRG